MNNAKIIEWILRIAVAGEFLWVGRKLYEGGLNKTQNPPIVFGLNSLFSLFRKTFGFVEMRQGARHSFCVSFVSFSKTDPDRLPSNRALEKTSKKPYNACIGLVLDRHCPQ